MHITSKMKKAYLIGILYSDSNTSDFIWIRVFDSDERTAEKIGDGRNALHQGLSQATE
jgi:hypothetical protein